MKGIENYLEIMRLLGKRVVKTGNCWWEEVQRFGYFPVPAGLPVAVKPDDIRSMFSAQRAIALRIISDGLGDDGELIHYQACKNRHYDLSFLGGEARRKVRKGLENCQILKFDKGDLGLLLNQGLKIHQSALVRQKRIGQRIFRDPDMWARLVKAWERIPEIRVYGAFFRNQLCSYMVVFQTGRLVFYLHNFSATDFLRYYPNNALLFYATKDIMRCPDVDEFHIGLESLSPKPFLDEFTLNLGFQKYPLRQKLILHPLLRPLLGSWTHAVINAGAKRLGSDYLVAADDFLHRVRQ